MLYHVPCHKK